MNIDKGEMGVQSLYNSDISAFNFEPNSEYPYGIWVVIFRNNPERE